MRAQFLLTINEAAHAKLFTTVVFYLISYYDTAVAVAIQKLCLFLNQPQLNKKQAQKTSEI